VQEEKAGPFIMEFVKIRNKLKYKLQLFEVQEIILIYSSNVAFVCCRFNGFLCLPVSTQAMIIAVVEGRPVRRTYTPQLREIKGSVCDKYIMATTGANPSGNDSLGVQRGQAAAGGGGVDDRGLNVQLRQTHGQQPHLGQWQRWRFFVVREMGLTLENRRSQIHFLK